MSKRCVIFAALSLAMFVTAAAGSDLDDDVNRIGKATQAFQEIMKADRGLPRQLLRDTAQCIAIIPGDVKFAFIFGGNYGRGVATCRTGHGWSAPIFVAIDGSSVGYQVGGSSTDIVMLFMNNRALQELLSDKFRLGSDASVSAGPVGQNGSGGTDVKINNTDVLTYSRSKGVFAGVSLDGTIVQADRSGDLAMYGNDFNRHDTLSGNVAAPASARVFLQTIHAYAD